MFTSMYDSPLVECPFGVLFQRHQNWWLVKFDTPESAPRKAYRLTGRVAPWLTKRLNPDAERGDFPGGRAPLPACDQFWAGKFVLSSAPEVAFTYDIGGYGRKQDATEQQARLAQEMVDSTYDPLPSAFTSVFKQLPAENGAVLAIRISNFVAATFEVITARYMPTYYPRSPWRDISGHVIVEDILGWRAAPDWIKPR